METNLGKVMSRIQKLLALGTSPNENEAASAMALAQKLMDEYRITQAMLEIEQDVPREKIKQHEFHVCKGDFLPQWESFLSSVISEINMCKTYFIHERGRHNGKTRAVLYIIGRESDAMTSRYMFQYIHKQINDLCEREYVRHGKPGLSWKFAFKTGCSSRVCHRLRNAHAENFSSANQTAIVRLSDVKAEVDKFAQFMGLKQGKGSKTKFDLDVVNAGYDAGNQVNIQSKTEAQMGAPAKQIGSGR